jgi:hypothetical protein
MDYFWASIQKREQAFSPGFDGHSRDRVSTTAQIVEGAAAGPRRAIPSDPPGLAARRLNPGGGRRRTKGRRQELAGRRRARRRFSRRHGNPRAPESRRSSPSRRSFGTARCGLAPFLDRRGDARGQRRRPGGKVSDVWRAWRLPEGASRLSAGRASWGPPGHPRPS